jgi:hypothetical protein
VHERELRVHEADKIYLTLQACFFDNRIERLLMKCSDFFSTLQMGAIEREKSAVSLNGAAKPSPLPRFQASIIW